MIQEAAAIFETFIEKHWDRSVLQPKVIVVEKSEQLRVALQPVEEEVIFIAEAPSGHRLKPRGNWRYYDEAIVVVFTIQTLTSYERLYEIANTLTAILQRYQTDVAPFHRTKVIGFYPEAEVTYQFWKGDLRIEVERMGICIGQNRIRSS
jgi:hypothetical protein